MAPTFVATYRGQPVKFGWNGLGETVFLRTYSRQDNPGVHGHETWVDVCERVINGMYQIQERHTKGNGIPWSSNKAQRSAREAFDLMFNMKWSPPGRGLQMMGTPFVMDRGVPEALQNCAFISSTDLVSKQGSFFSWIMHMSMLGVGVGFDTKGADTVYIHPPRVDRRQWWVIPDTREGWAEALELLINSYARPDQPEIYFQFSSIRVKGATIAGFGGVASGPAPLKTMLYNIRGILHDRSRGQGTHKLTSTDIVDIANHIGVCVVSGNVRRSAEIAFGDPNDMQFIDLKNYTKNPERADFGWVSNNSVMVTPGQDYSYLAERTYENGEPGYAWMDNVHNYGRMNGITDEADWLAKGFNPCGEQPLEDKEMCTLVEIYLPHIKDKAELRRVIKFAYLYGKSVTLATDRITDDTTRQVMQSNRRIGLSMTGITQFVGRYRSKGGYQVLYDWMDHGYHWSGDYDRIYSQYFNVPTSIRRTSVKPSGSVSLVAGVTPGIHFNVEGRYHVRRVTLADNSPLIVPLSAAGYLVEPSVVDPNNSVVVSFPVDAGPGVKSEQEIEPTEHLSLIYGVSRLWADNAVSATVKFDKTKYTPSDIETWLEHAETRVKDISFLPLNGAASYEQAPYEGITEEEYEKQKAALGTLDFSHVTDAHDQDDKFCDGEACAIK